MNLTKLGFSAWIIILNITLLLTLLYVISIRHRDSFTNYPSLPSNPLAKPGGALTGDVAEANNNYASILMFIQKNPSNSVRFIEDIKQKFFDESCKVKSNIDFNNITQLPRGMTFN
jgi:hypothetical protein